MPVGNATTTATTKRRDVRRVASTRMCIRRRRPHPAPVVFPEMIEPPPALKGLRLRLVFPYINQSSHLPNRSNLMSLAACMPSSFKFFSICLLRANAALSSADEVHPILLQAPSVQNVAPVFFRPAHNQN